MTKTKRVRNFALLGLAGFAASFTLGACFNGLESEGLPCESNNQCAVGQACVDGYCNGVFFCEDGASIEAGNVCDDFPDCLDGSDEDPSLCAETAEGEEEGEGQFECSDGELIPLAELCDETEDCDEGEDELGCAGIGANMCGGSGGEDIAFEAEQALQRPLMNPLPVKLLNFLGPDTPEIITGSDGSDQLEVISFGDDGNAAFSQIGPFEGQTIAAFDVADINGDGKGDIVVATEGVDGFTTYVYQNNVPNQPIAYGTPFNVELPGDIEAPVGQALKLARLNNDSDLDAVAIVDSDSFGRGLLLVALGDSSAADEDGPYFTPVLIETVPPLDYDMFFDAAVGDFDDVSPLDDVLVAGDVDMQPRLWLISRLDEGEDAWSAPTLIDVGATMPRRLAVGTFGPGPGVAILDPMRGELQIVSRQGMGGSPVGGATIDFGMTMPEGLTLSDINCDGFEDFLLYRGEGVEAYLGGGGMEVITNLDDPISFPLDGLGRGRMGAADYNGDGIPDVVATLEGAVQIGSSTGMVERVED